MRKICPLLIAMFATSAQADLWKLYDGNGTAALSNAPQMHAGVTVKMYNAAAWLRWENEGGDWWDAAGVRQGTVPFSAAAPVAGKITLDVTALMGAEGYIVKTIPRKVLSLHSREGTVPPELQVTLADGSLVTLLPTADSSLSKSTTTAQGKSLTLNVYDAAVLAFPPMPEGAASARLVLSVASGSGTVGVYKMHVPRRPIPEPSTGYAAAYPFDAGIGEDPRTIYFESWDRPNGDRPADWWTKTGQTAGPNAQWKQDGGLFLNPNWSGMWIADGSGTVKAQCSDILMDRGLGYINDGLTGIHCRDVLARGTDSPTVFFKTLRGNQIDEGWARWLIKYDMQHTASALCEGGKAPGFAGNTAYGGNSGNPGYGVGGWSMRNQFHPICDPDNPGFGLISFSTYSYDGDRFGDLNGGHWGEGEITAIPLGEWVCIEQRVKINTPGQWDGAVELWINDRLAFSKTDVYLRSEKPPQGYGDWQLVSKTYPVPNGAQTWTDARGKLFYWQNKTQDDENSIHKFWGTVHWGGKTPSGADHQFWIDQTVIATERIGCPVMTSTPPDEPPPDVTPPDETPPEEPEEEAPPVKSELEIVREQLAKAQADLADAHDHIALNVEAAGTMAGRLAALQADLLIVEAREAAALTRATQAEEIVNQVREVVK